MSRAAIIHFGTIADAIKLPRYHHIITGAKSPSAPDALGGILADDMGLGKSLTMLAAVAGTTTNAWQYARENTTWSVGNEEGLIAAKTTLVIVPSACRGIHPCNDSLHTLTESLK